MDDTQKKLYYSMKSENSSLKKKLDDMAQKYENLKKRKYNITNELKLAKRSACSLIAFLRGYNVSSLTRYNRYITLRFHF